MPDCAARPAIHITGEDSARAAVEATLAHFGDGACAYAARACIAIVVLEKRQRYRDVSLALRRMGVDVDRWPVPPAGLFVVEERTMFLRSASPMTVAHEIGHALDCALGAGVYRSGFDPRIRSAFATATAFVTPYAATGLDEYFAESLRAYVEVNDAASPWPKATRQRMREVDPAMFGIASEFFTTEFQRVPAA